MPERFIISGDPGTTWHNDSDQVRYQFICELRRTCAVCLQYHHKIGNTWPIPIHHNCRCQQRLILPGESAPYPFTDYRALLDTMSETEQAAAIGASNYRLLKSGLATWDDIVTKNRIRDFREVVARKKLTVNQMVKHGVKRYQAQKAYDDVHTAEHEHVARQQRELVNRITAAGVSHDKLVEELSKRLAHRVTIAAGPTGAQAGRPQDGNAPAWQGGKLPGTGASHAAELATLISAWRPPKKRKKPKQPTETPKKEEPKKAPTPPPRREPEEPVPLITDMLIPPGEPIPPRAPTDD